MLTVTAYMKVIPASNKNPEKPKSLTNFVTGVNATGDRGIIHNDSNLLPSDVAIIQGYVHEDSKHAPHLQLRQRILDFQKNNKGRTIIVDSNLFLYRDPGNTKGYLRYSYDGIFPNTGEYCYDKPDPQRWEKIKKDLGIDLKPWRQHGNHILLCLQRNGGWSMKGMSVVDFFKQSVSAIRNYSSRPIVVRTHPGDRKAMLYLQHLTGSNVFLSRNKTLTEDLQSAWATVVYNSSPAVASIIEGVPSFVIDPEYSQATPVANTDIALIEHPLMPDRLHWVRQIAQCHWNDQDLITGAAWQHMRHWVRQ